MACLHPHQISLPYIYIYIYDLFETLVTPVILYVCDVWGCNISRESWRKIEQIQKRFITYKIKIKSIHPTLFSLQKWVFPLSRASTWLLLYKHKINNMGDHRLPKIAFNSIQYHLRLKQGWYKYTRAQLNHWEIDKNVAVQNINNIKNIVLLSLKRNCGVRKIQRLKEN